MAAVSHSIEDEVSVPPLTDKLHQQDMYIIFNTYTDSVGKHRNQRPTFVSSPTENPNDTAYPKADLGAQSTMHLCLVESFLFESW